MNQKGCGICFFQGDTKVEKDGVFIYCIYDYQWHKGDYTCKQWIEFSNNIPKEHRIIIANSKRETEQRLQQHEEILKSERDNRELLVKVSLFSFLTGILVIVIAQYILWHWGIK